AFPIPLLAPVTIAVFGCIVYTSFILHLILRNCPFSHNSYHHLFTLLQKYSLYSFLCILVLHSKCQLPGHPLFGFLLIVVRVVHTVQVLLYLFRCLLYLFRCLLYLFRFWSRSCFYFSIHMIIWLNKTFEVFFLFLRKFFCF